MNGKQCEIINVLNHNTLICKNDDGETYVFFGKGIGFKKKKGEKFINDDNVQDYMLVLEAKEALKYKELLNQVTNKKLIDVVQNIVYEANKEFDNKINAKLNLTLLDHLNFAMERQKNNIIINYPFLSELSYIYPKEYEFSKRAFNYINRELKDSIQFDKAELGFLVLHIHAAIKNMKVSNLLLNNTIVYDCRKLIEKETKTKIDYRSIYYTSFIKHLEYAIQRYKDGIRINNVLWESIKDKCNIEYIVAEKINNILKEKYNINLDENEIGYIALHIYKLRNRKININLGKG